MNLIESLNNRGLQYLDQRNLDVASNFFREVLKHDPNNADAHVNLGKVAYNLGEYRQARYLFEKAMAADKNNREDLLTNYAYVLWKLGELETAIEIFTKADRNHNSDHARIALGGLYWETGDVESTIYHLDFVCNKIECAENDNLYGNEILCKALTYDGSKDEAIAQCTKLYSIPIHPQPDHYIVNRALIKLTYDLTDWQDYEARYDTSEADITVKYRTDPKWMVKLHDKRWDGKPTKHLLISQEQGYGDIIQFMRYVPLAAERCERLTIDLPLSLHSLAKISFDHKSNIEVVDGIDNIEFDHYCLLLSLPYLLGSNEAPIPYLFTSIYRNNDIRIRKDLKIGLVWSGGSQLKEDSYRSIPFDFIRQLVKDVDGINFFSLQLPLNDNLDGLPIIFSIPEPRYIGRRDKVQDWNDTAAVIDALDLVISVDTAVAHLAGALGKPVWLLNRYNTDWRWGLKDSTTPWYPTMRIFRQPKMNDWKSVIENVKDELMKL